MATDGRGRPKDVVGPGRRLSCEARRARHLGPWDEGPAGDVFCTSSMSLRVSSSFSLEPTDSDFLRRRLPRPRSCHLDELCQHDRGGEQPGGELASLPHSFADGFTHETASSENS